MRVIAHVTLNSGVSYHRLIMPLVIMSDVDLLYTNNLKDEYFDKGCDLFIYNRTLPDVVMQKVKFFQKKLGFKICVDIDDYWELDPHHVLYQEYQRINFAALQIRHLRDADVILTTHERLRNEILPYNSNVHICPNAIPHQGQYAIKKEPYYLTRLFWQGSDTHRKDVEILEKPIFQLNTLSPKIKMVMSGHAEENEEWDRMAQVYTANFKHQYLIIPYEPVTSYYSHYANADICLVPLVESKFNSMKSNLKVLEAANLGLPVIASDVHPYKDLPIFYAKHSGDWLKYIKRLVESPKRQKVAGRELKAFCQEHFNFNKINLERKQILEYEAGKQAISRR